MHLVGLFKLV